MPTPLDNLTARCLTSPNRADVAAIESTMLWPHSDDDAEAAYGTGVVVFARSVLSETDGAMLAQLVDLALRAEPPGHRREEAQLRFIDGLRAGLYLRRALVGQQLKNAARDVAAYPLGNAVSTITPKTFENRVWPHYRKVAHFWCAAIDHGASGDHFPCGAQRLPEFLARSEWYRVTGETARTKQSPATILRHHETIRPPFPVEPLAPVN